MARICSCLMVIVAAGVLTVRAQTAAPSGQSNLVASVANTKMETTDDWNRRLEELVHTSLANGQANPSPGDYRIGPNDLLTINVLDAPDLSGPVRVAADGQISVPLLGTVKAAGLTPRELELVLQALLHRTYMKDPHVSVIVTEMQSHSVSVLGSVKNPGSFQIPGTKTLLEMLSMAGGIAPDAGDTVLVMRGGSAGFVRDGRGQAQKVTDGNSQDASANGVAASSTGKTGDGDSVAVSLKKLLDSGDPQYNILIYPGDIIKVKAAGIVYVVGDVNRPGGFPIPDNEQMTILQAIALGSGLAPNAAKNKARIIRIAQNGEKIEVPVRLDKILSGNAQDVALRPKDVLFVPKNGTKAASKAVLDTFSKWIVWRGIP